MLNFDEPSRIFPCILLTRNHMIFLVLFGLNKHLLIFLRLQIARARRASAILVVFQKIYSCLFIPNCTRNLVITYTNIVIGRSLICKILLYLWVAIYVSNLIQRCEILVRFFVCFPLSAPEMISNVWNVGERTNRTTADVSWWRRGNWLFRCVAKLIKWMSG